MPRNLYVILVLSSLSGIEEVEMTLYHIQNTYVSCQK